MFGSPSGGGLQLENTPVVKMNPAGLVVSGVFFTDSKHLAFHHVLLFYAV